MLIEDFLKRVGSKMTHEEIMHMPMAELGWQLQIIGGSTEDLHPKNVGLLLFSQEPEKYFPYARIEIVHFLDEVGDRFTEKILHGPIHLQLEAALKYIREQVLLEKVIKVRGEAEAIRCFNYPYEALEEILANAVFHKSWDDRNMHFLATMPIHQAFIDEKAYLASKGKDLDEENKDDFGKVVICLSVFRLQWNPIAPSKRRDICSKTRVVIIITLMTNLG